MRFVVFIPLFIGLMACSPDGQHSSKADKSYVFGGPAQGTSYMVKYHGPGLEDYQQSVDSILEVIDLSLSTYVEHSTISEFNRQMEFETSDPHFVKMVFDSKEFRELSKGAFEPTVMPLVRAWGFGYGAKDRPNPTDAELDSLMQLITWDFEMKISNETSGANGRKTTMTLLKRAPVEFDFNGIAQGYTVDVIMEFLKNKGVEDALVEVGGEVRASGVNEGGDPWMIGIDQPDEHAERGSQAHLQLKNRAVATSGNYRKFYERDGKKLSHTIDPRTGRPVDHQLLSVTVIANTCTMADAMATVFMVMGPEKSRTFLQSEKGKGMDAYLVYTDAGGKLLTYRTPGLETLLDENPPAQQM